MQTVQTPKSAQTVQTEVSEAKACNGPLLFTEVPCVVFVASTLELEHTLQEISGAGLLEDH